MPFRARMSAGVSCSASHGNEASNVQSHPAASLPVIGPDVALPAVCGYPVLTSSPSYELMPYVNEVLGKLGGSLSERGLTGVTPSSLRRVASLAIAGVQPAIEVN